MLSLSKVFNAQTVLKSIIRETNVVRAHGIAPECKLYLKPELYLMQKAEKLQKFLSDTVVHRHKTAFS